MKNEVYQIITDRIIAMLEKGTVPWHKPWNGRENAPRNLISGKQYRGINTFLLGAMNYSSPYWLSFKQAQQLGGNVRKGEKSTPIVFWKQLAIADKEQPNGKRVIPFLRYYSGFNIGQCENIPAEKIPVSDIVPNIFTPVQQAEKIIADMPKKPVTEIGADRACYIPTLDVVQMPSPEMFNSSEEFYSTQFHELIHSTGHPSRLNRSTLTESAGFGSNPYCKEELVAEMGAAFLCGTCGIVERTIDNSAAYIASWLRRLKDDDKLVVCAAGQAQRASDFILAKQFETEQMPVAA